LVFTAETAETAERKWKWKWKMKMKTQDEEPANP
jgi:hypothetical protein